MHHQVSLFDESAPPRPKVVKKPATKPRKPSRGEFEPIAPPNLAQESALWLTGQRSIEAQRGKRYVPASVKHPGKMQPDVCGAIIDTYTEPGWHIVDAMGGIGTTGVEGAERGRHVTCVELVRHWANVAYANSVRTAYRGAPGTMRVIHGDARRLPELLAGLMDAAVFSPPYGEALEQRTGRMEGRAERLRQAIQDGGQLRGNWHFGAGQRAMMAPQYDAAVMSPPFGPTQTGRGMALTGINGDGRPPVERGIGATYDVAVFSPPYGPADTAGEDLTRRTSAAVVDEKGLGYRWKGFGQRHYASTNHDGPQVDAVITSPAYGDIRQDGGDHQFGEGSAMTNYTGEARVKKGARDRTNVGNLKYGSMDKALIIAARLTAGEAIPEAEWPDMQYLETMVLIYRGCWQVVRQGGLCILVLKDYRRDKRRVNLVGDTIRLMEAVGWLLHDRALALTSKIDNGQVISKVSPFVRLNARKPEKNGGKVLLPCGEDILVFRKE
jgi:hypothetical protein